MGLLALSDFIGEITANVGNRTDLTPQRIIFALNFAQDKISQAQDFQELETVQITATNYTGVPLSDKLLPYAKNWKTVHSAVLKYNIDSRKLKNIPWRKFDRLYPAPEAVAAYIPLVYTNWNFNMVFMPVPNAVYPLVVRVTTYPIPYTLATPPATTSSFMGKDQIIIDFACAYLWKSFGRWDKAEAAMESANQQLQLAMSGDSNRPDLDTSGSADDQGPSSGAYWANPWITTVDGS